MSCSYLTSLLYPSLTEVSQISLAHFIIVLMRSTFFCAGVLQVGAADVNGFQHSICHE